MICKCIGWLALLIAVLGAINWGLWGFFQFDFVAFLFKGNTTAVSRVVYSIIGLAGVYSLKKLFCCSRRCSCACHKDSGGCHKDSSDCQK